MSYRKIGVFAFFVMIIASVALGQDVPAPAAAAAPAQGIAQAVPPPATAGEAGKETSLQNPAPVANPSGETNAAPVDSIAQEITNQSKPEPPSASEQVQQQADEFKKKFGIEFGKTQGEKTYYFNWETVAVPPTDPNWGKARSLAYTQALLKAQSDFLRDTYGKKAAEIFQKEFSDNSSNNEEFADLKLTDLKDLNWTNDQWGRLFEKLSSLADATPLNKILTENGVDIQKIKAMVPEQKKTTFQKVMTTNTLTNSIGEINGLIPIQSFEGKDSKGTHTIGVILMYSPKTKQLARDIAARRQTLIASSKGLPLEDVIPSDGQTLVNDFGVRCLWNEQGKPCIVSFGQWSLNYTGENERVRERMRGQAERQALDSADAEIAFFVAGNMMWQEKNERGLSSEDYVAKATDGFIRRQEDLTNIIDKMNSEIRQKASLDLGGILTHKTWHYKHPYGQETLA